MDKQIKPGERFDFGGYNWVMLDEHGLSISTEVIFNYQFGMYNNWAKCPLRTLLNSSFIERLQKNGADLDKLQSMTTLLTSDIGEVDYMTSTDRVALISCEQYRRFRELIPPTPQWYWTVTPSFVSTNKGNMQYVECVTPSWGFVSNPSYQADALVRPIIKVKLS